MNPQRVTAEELAQYEAFQEDGPELREWLAEHFEVRTFEPGQVTVKEGDPADHFFFILEGEIHFRRTKDAYGNVFVGKQGHAVGLLPFSRMKFYAGSGVAAERLRVAALPAALLRELVYRGPNLAQRLVGEMTDRTRESTRIDERRNKMLALGKLSAGLAHELNNPASAAVRSSRRLREVLMERRRVMLVFRATVIPPAAQDLLAELNQHLANCVEAGLTLDPLEKADREGEMADWLASFGAPPDLASDLVDVGITLEQIRPLRDLLPAETFGRGLKVLACDAQILCLARELEEASTRISALVQTVKQYSYMDRTPLSEVNLTEGIDVTLRMFQHQIKQGVQVKKDYDPNVPALPANGNELNQVWTNLIDNALDALCEITDRPKTLSIRTLLEPTTVLIEIADNGPGIPPEVQARMFEPFYTTKPFGEGTGLGLDIVQRIVDAHKGSIRVESEAGRTAFQVRLPRP